MTHAVIAERVPVLMYHRVDESLTRNERRYGVTPRQFAAHLDWLATNGWRPCTIGGFDRWYRGEATLPERTVLITFDDGFASLHRHALPLLAERGWPATVFLVSALVGQRDAWTAREFAAGAGHELLNREQIVEMARHGIEFQSHSRTHRDLTALGDEALAEQVTGSRAELQQLLGRPVDYFAYPFGRADERVRRAVHAAGYRLAFSVNPGFNRPDSAETWAVRRLDITGHDSRARFGRKVALGTNEGSLGAQLRYLGQRAVSRVLG